MKIAMVLAVLFLTAAGTVMAQKLEVIAPNGGEILVSGTPVTITWSFYDLNADETVRITLEGTADHGPIAFSKASAMSHEWLAGKKMDGTFARPDGDYRIHIALVGSDQAGDASDAPFAIVPPPSVVALLAPNGGEMLEMGGVFAITWSCSRPAGYVSLNLVRGGQPLGRIAENLPAASFLHRWRIGAPLLNGMEYAPGDDYRLQIQWRDRPDPGQDGLDMNAMRENSDRSDDAFSIR